MRCMSFDFSIFNLSNSIFIFRMLPLNMLTFVFLFFFLQFSYQQGRFEKIKGE
jgi:hypothetical protein